MPRPVLWLGLTTVVLGIAVITLILLLFLNVFEQPKNPSLQDRIAAANTSPWTPFTAAPKARCMVYPVVHEGDPNPPAPTGTSVTCTPINSVAAILTQRQCRADGCVDLNGQPQSVGYVEEAYQDCSVDFSCQSGTTGCFQPIPSCTDSGISEVQVATNGLCITDPNTNRTGSLLATPCTDAARNQQFNLTPQRLIPFGQPYRISTTLLEDFGSCVTPSVNNTVSTIEKGPCGAGAYFVIPQSTVQVPYNTTQGTASTFAATVPLQLLWVPDVSALPNQLPTSYNALVTFSSNYFSLQGQYFRPMIPACVNGELPPGRVVPNLPQCSSIVTAITPTAYL